MAEHADGSIIVDTEIDAQGFKAGSSELQRAIKSLNTKIQSLGPTFQKALSGNSSAIAAFGAKASALESTISEIEAKMKSLGQTQVPTDGYQWLTTEIQKAENELDKLIEKQIKMEDTGVRKNSRAWQSLQYDIDLAKRKISEYEAEQAGMRANGTAFQSGANTLQYKELEADLASANNKLTQMRAEASSTGNTLDKSGKKGNSSFSKLGATLKKSTSKLRQFTKQSNRVSYSMNSFGGRVRMMIMMLKQMLVMRAFMGIVSSIGEGFKNLSQYSSQTNKDLSILKSALTQLKNSFATAFAPVLTVVTPILQTLINYLATAITYVGKFVAALTGAKTFIKATAVQEDFAASLNETAKAAKEAKKQLAEFDELNILADSSSDSGDAGIVSPSEMFEEVHIESRITDFVRRLKKAFKNGDYDSIGAIIGRGINTAVQKINEYIRWDHLGQKISNGIKGAAQGFNTMVDTVDWGLVGDTLAQGFNTALNTLFSVVTVFDWPALGESLAESLNGMVYGIDWSMLGRTLSAGLLVALSTLRITISTFDWSSLGAGIAESINNIDWVALLSNISGSISDAVQATYDLLIGFVETLDWGKLGRTVWEGVIAVVSNYDWVEICKLSYRLLGDAVGAAISFRDEFCKTFWESVISGLFSVWLYFEPYIEEAGGNLVQGIFNGIIDALKSIVSWIDENIFTPFIDGFKSTFKINSGFSEKTKEQGKYIIKGLLNGMLNTWIDNNIPVLGAIEFDITDLFIGLKEKAVTWGKDLVENMANGITKAKDTVVNAVKGVAEKIKAFLGFSEPETGPLSNFHTYMPDMIDLMTFGIKKNQGKAVGAVSDMASAISKEIQNGDYAIGEVGITQGVESSLDRFSDKISDGFITLVERLQAIADGVTFTMPRIATGSVVPYSVSATMSSGENITETIEASNDELSSVIIQVVTNATAAIVKAIEDNGGTSAPVDINSIATNTIKEINRRTIAMGKSPLVTA